MGKGAKSEDMLLIIVMKEWLMESFTGLSSVLTRPALIIYTIRPTLIFGPSPLAGPAQHDHPVAV